MVSPTVMGWNTRCAGAWSGAKCSEMVFEMSFRNGLWVGAWVRRFSAAPAVAGVLCSEAVGTVTSQNVRLLSGSSHKPSRAVVIGCGGSSGSARLLWLGFARTFHGVSRRLDWRQEPARWFPQRCGCSFLGTSAMNRLLPATSSAQSQDR